MGLNCLMKNLQVNSQIYYISLCYEVMSVNIDNIGLSFQIVKMVEPDKRVQKLDKIVRESNGFFCLYEYHSKSRQFCPVFRPGTHSMFDLKNRMFPVFECPVFRCSLYSYHSKSGLAGIQMVIKWTRNKLVH
jgi:hypothetical protein